MHLIQSRSAVYQTQAKSWAALQTPSRLIKSVGHPFPTMALGIRQTVSDGGSSHKIAVVYRFRAF